jgi:hypothetical protein
MKHRGNDCAVLVFALLLAGCAHASEERADTSAEHEETIVSGEMHVEASENNASGETVGLTSEDYQPGIGNSVWMNTETGLYYYGIPRSFEGITVSGLRYYDLETGADIYLCSKPECAHDGNAYCISTSDQDQVQYVGMYEGAIYMTVIVEKDNQTEWKLYRVALDGTEKTEVCTYYKMKNVQAEWGNSKYCDDLILHRGKAIIQSACSDDQNCMYEAIIVDLETGTSEALQVNGQGMTELGRFGAEYMLAAGDWLYFMTTSREKQNVYSYWRYNLETKAAQQLDIPEKAYSYTVYQETIYYAQQALEEQQVQLYAYDPESGDTLAIGTPFEQTISNDDAAKPRITTDGVYLYYGEHGFQLDSENGEEPSVIHVLGFDGQEVTSFQIPTDIGDDSTSIHRRCSFKNGKAYLIYGKCRYSYDFLDEDAEWQFLYNVNAEYS